ncbi:MAG TPA: DUF4157 domain-containing protein [Thermoanaerobaculia bacterium]|nr:DUF4157 domain-containing protein [Thermoanaerobaculia bacterium]
MKRGRFLRRDSEGALVEADPPSGTASTPNSTARVQRAVGNQALQKAIRDAKKGGGERARYERDADETARQALAGPGAAAVAGPGPIRNDPAAREIEAALGAGRPLSEGVRARFEGHFGRDLGDVRLHAGPEAGALAREAGARAFTAGRHVVFAEGELPAHPEGSPLLAHELAHVAQQAGDASAPAVQCQPAPQPQGPNFDQLLLALNQWIVHPLTDISNPPEIRHAMLAIAYGKTALGQLDITRLATATWSSGRNIVRADSQWRADGKPEIAVSDDLLSDFGTYDADRQMNTAAGFAVIRTLAHELRHLDRQKERAAGQRGATIAEKRFEKEAGRLAAETPNKLTVQEYTELPPGRQLFDATVYAYEEVLARLEEVLFVGRELAAMRAKGGPTRPEREHLADVLHSIGYNIQYYVQVLQVSAQGGKAGMAQTDFATVIQEIEAEIARRYTKVSTAPKRLWDLVKEKRFLSQYAPRGLEQAATPGGGPGEYEHPGQIVTSIVSLVFPEAKP